MNRAVQAKLASVRRRLDLGAAAGVLAAGEHVTMDEVAAHLRLAKPTLYRLAGSKEELVRACVEAEAERLLGHLHEALDGGDALPSAVRAVSRYAAYSPGGFRLLFGGRRAEAEVARRRIEARVADLVGRDEVVAAALLGAAVGAVGRALAEDLVVDPEALAAAL